jgi:hypothetical protein
MCAYMLDSVSIWDGASGLVIFFGLCIYAGLCLDMCARVCGCGARIIRVIGRVGLGWACLGRAGLTRVYAD